MMLRVRSCSPDVIKILVAGNLVSALAGGDRLGLHHAEVGAAMGLGEAHRAGPFAGHHFRQIAVFQLVGGVGLNRRIGAVVRPG